MTFLIIFLKCNRNRKLCKMQKVKNSDNTTSHDYNFEELDKPISLEEAECVIKTLKRKEAFAGDQSSKVYFI